MTRKCPYCGVQLSPNEGEGVRFCARLHRLHWLEHEMEAAAERLNRLPVDSDLVHPARHLRRRVERAVPVPAERTESEET